MTTILRLLRLITSKGFPFELVDSTEISSPSIADSTAFLLTFSIKIQIQPKKLQLFTDPVTFEECISERNIKLRTDWESQCINQIKKKEFPLCVSACMDEADAKRLEATETKVKR